jgi:glycosyltransferase involved in cell wall biosynthesis
MSTQNKPDDLLITIAIPTYNRAQSYLPNALESALNQTYRNIEIIVSDNNSSDNTEEVVRSYKDPRIRYFKQKENIGSIPNTNFCIGQATGTYFLMLHDDDSIDPDFVQTCVEAAGFRKDIGIIMTGSRIINSEGEVIASKENITAGRSIDDFMIAWYEQKIHMLLCSILFHIETLRSVGGFREDYGMFDDVAAEFIVAARGGRVAVPDVKATFRNHAASFGKSATIAEWCDNSISLVNLSCSLAENKRQELYKTAMKNSADRMYRYSLRSGSKWVILKTFFIVWRKFGFRYLPPKKYQYRVFPSLRIVYFPFSAPRKIYYRLMNSYRS